MQESRPSSSCYIARLNQPNFSLQDGLAQALGVSTASMAVFHHHVASSAAVSQVDEREFRARGIRGSRLAACAARSIASRDSVLLVKSAGRLGSGHRQQRLGLCRCRRHRSIDKQRCGSPAGISCGPTPVRLTGRSVRSLWRLGLSRFRRACPSRGIITPNPAFNTDSPTRGASLACWRAG